MVQLSSTGEGAKFESGKSNALLAVIATCGTYFCMYMYRKPFTAAKYADLAVWGLGYKSVLVISQVIGYSISKFIGIRVIAELDRARRVALLLILVLISELALVGFGLTPAPYSFLWLFLNGLPLGMIFGLVLGFLEGRRQTELLTAGLCTTFVFADGIAKTIGSGLIGKGISESWMPAVVGILFAPAFLLFVWMLTRVAPPDEQDVEARTERISMDRADRQRFFGKFAFGLALILLVYGLVGILRGVRGDFAPEIWAGMNAKVDPSVYATSEMLAGAGVLAVFAFTARIINNRKAFFVGMASAVIGCLIVAMSLIGRQSNLISPYNFMVISGFGLYLPYFAVHVTIFERLIAFTRERGTIGYLMYLADAGSYAAYVFVLAARNLSKPGPDAFLPFFYSLNWVIAIVGMLALVPAALYFGRLKSST